MIQIISHQPPLPTILHSLIVKPSLPTNPLDRFLEESGYVDASLLAPPNEMIERDDNHDLDFDFSAA
jgi:hypothetical protein